MHFDKSRQLGEEKAHMEMFVSMNGPVLVRADPLLKRAMDKFFKDKNPRWDGAWRMYHSDETRFYPQDESKTLRRLQKEKSKLGFVDANIKMFFFSVLLVAGSLNLRSFSRMSRES